MSKYSGQLNHPATPVNRRRRLRARTYLAGLALLVGILALGCSQGSYPLDIFYEMHYQPSYKPSEPPRLSAPESAVPFFPPPQATSFANDGQHLFEVNCSMCHGAQGRGDGPVLTLMQEQYGYVPSIDPDLTSETVKVLGINGVQSFMMSGIIVMPSFANLLTDEEVQAISDYVMSLSQ